MTRLRSRRAIYAQPRARGWRLYGGAEANTSCQTTPHGAHSRRCAGGAAGAFRPEADAHVSVVLNDADFILRADGGGHRPLAGLGAGDAVDSRRWRLQRRRTRTWRRFWTR